MLRLFRLLAAPDRWSLSRRRCRSRIRRSRLLPSRGLQFMSTPRSPLCCFSCPLGSGSKETEGKSQATRQNTKQNSHHSDTCAPHSASVIDLGLPMLRKATTRFSKSSKDKTAMPPSRTRLLHVVRDRDRDHTLLPLGFVVDSTASSTAFPARRDLVRPSL